MQFLANGIDIPDELIRAHEEGRVVFFCGAGISYESHLPDFECLTENIFRRVGEVRTSAEDEMFKHHRYDAVIGSLENRIARPELVRKAIADELTPNKTCGDNSVETHKALLTLATVGKERQTLQLVTTNFDLIFEELLDDYPVGFKRYVAPLLPIPRVGLWNGLVYLHGRLPKADDEDNTALANLVTASGDYGRAYLSEAWAARFVNELLRNYVVCFVGYSMGDATVRYLTDAVEVYKRSGNKTEPVYMFMDSTRQDVLTTNESIVAIRYNPNACGGNHAVLHMTLKAWAAGYQDGINAKCAIVKEFARTDPTVVPDDGYVSRMRWALSDASNKSLECFVGLSERPSFGWVKRLCNDGCFDSNLFGREENCRGRLWAYFVVRHVSDPECLGWIIANQSRFFNGFNRMLENVCDGELKEQDVATRECVPIHVPRFAERLLRLIIAGRVSDGTAEWMHRGLDYEHWVFHGDLDVLKQARIVSEYSPSIKVKLTHPIFFANYLNLRNVPLRKRFSAELSFVSQLSKYRAKKIHEELKGSLWRFVVKLSSSFEDALDALEYLLENGCEESSFALQVPSIEDHSQNDPEMHELIPVVLMIREGWRELLSRDRLQARSLALKWLASPHCAMKRFGLFAAKVSDVIAPAEWCSVFTDHCGSLLWLPSVKREMLRLFATKGGELDDAHLKLLSDRILRGRPSCFSLGRSWNKEEVDCAIDHAKFVRLGKLMAAGAALPIEARDEFNRIKEYNPAYTIADDESDEFYVYSTVTDAGCEEHDFQSKQQDLVPHDEDRLVDWLDRDRDVPKWPGRHHDGFNKLCKDDPATVKSAIVRTIANSVINVARIVEAIDAWRGDDTFGMGVDLLVNVVAKMASPSRDEIITQLTGWCEDVIKAKRISSEDLKLIGRLFMKADYGEMSKGFRVNGEKDLITPAINHPLGRITTGLIEACFPERIRKGVGIPEPYKSIFTDLLELSSAPAWNARLVLASRAIAFYYVDEDWTRRYLLPYGEWCKESSEAAVFWQGYLWQRSLHIPILVDLKKQFIATFDHFDELCDDGRAYISLLISLVFLHIPDFPDEEITPLIRKMSVKQLQVAATVVEDYMCHCEKAEKDVNMIWREKVWPFLHGMWPKDKEHLSDETIRRLCMAALVAYDEFGKHLNDYWFVGKMEHLSYFLNVVAKSSAIKKCPDAVLEMVVNVVKDVGYESDSLNAVLDAIKSSKAGIEHDSRYIHLRGKIDEA